MRLRNFLVPAAICIVFAAGIVSAQSEKLTNADVILLSRSGLGKELLINKIKNSQADFDVSVTGLVELKKAGVDDVVVAVMMEKAREKREAVSTAGPSIDPTKPGVVPAVTFENAKQALATAKTLAIKKSSLNPSRQALEKELLKRSEWKNYNLTITEYKDTADLYVDIGFVHGSVITHRYVYRVYDRRTGMVIAAGETTSWGSLAENLARNILRSLEKVRLA
jgi:4-hydroxy-3-methylbut-2-en-1-yl diphosphate synthase IspG/GcpE